MAAVGVIGMWDPAMNTLSQVLVAVASSVVLAVPLGIWSGTSDRVHAGLQADPRHHADHAAVRLSRAGRGLVRRRPRAGRDRGADLCDAAGYPAHRPRDPAGAEGPRRGGRSPSARRRCRLVEGAAAPGPSVDPAGREPDRDHGLLGRDHRRARGRSRSRLPRRGRALAQPRDRRGGRARDPADGDRDRPHHPGAGAGLAGGRRWPPAIGWFFGTSRRRRLPYR